MHLKGCKVFYHLDPGPSLRESQHEEGVRGPGELLHLFFSEIESELSTEVFHRVENYMDVI